MYATGADGPTAFSRQATRSTDITASDLTRTAVLLVLEHHLRRLQHASGPRPDRDLLLLGTRQEVLDGARPLPSDEQSVIEQLTDDEASRFLDAILDR